MRDRPDAAAGARNEAQEWFERLSPFGRGFERRLFDGTRDDPVAVARAGAGANMALRRTVLEEVGPFDEALDAGTETRSGGDHEMFGRILAAGYRIVYEPRAVSWHRHRRTWEELREAIHGYGVGVYAMWTRRLMVDRELGRAAARLALAAPGADPAIVAVAAARDGQRPERPAARRAARLRRRTAGVRRCSTADPRP